MPLHLPLIGQIVKESAPQGFKTGAPGKPLLESSRFKTTFFESGPTSVFDILDVVDERIRPFNTRSAEIYIPCTEQEPVAYTIEAMGETLTKHLSNVYFSIGADGETGCATHTWYGARTARSWSSTAPRATPSTSARPRPPPASATSTMSSS